MERRLLTAAASCAQRSWFSQPVISEAPACLPAAMTMAPASVSTRASRRWQQRRSRHPASTITTRSRPRRTTRWDGTSMPQPGDAAYPGGRYRTLTPDSTGAMHPGCSIDGLSYTPASIPGYACAAREFPFPDGTTEDTTKPIVILVHGNSESPTGWMKFLHPDPSSLMFPGRHRRARSARRAAARARLPHDRGRHAHRSDRRPEQPRGQGHRQHAEELRPRLDGAAPRGADQARRDREPGSPALAVVGFSLGATTVRDALRRLWVENQDGKWDIEHLRASSTR